MTTDLEQRVSRRGFLCAACVGLTVFGLTGANAQGNTLKIGVIGSGRVGSAVGEQWVKAGHAVMFSSLDLAHDKALAAKLGRGARAGIPREAAAFGEVLFFAVPYSALISLGRELTVQLKGKVVLDASNPFAEPDRKIPAIAQGKGAGVASAELLAGSRLVRAFNTISFELVRSQSKRNGERHGVPLVGNDTQALKIAAGLVTDAGFDPVIVGGLERAKEFDYGSALFGKPLTAAEYRKAFGLGR